MKENGKFLQFNEMYQLNVCVLEHYGVIMIHILLNKQLQERQQLYLAIRVVLYHMFDAI